MLRSLTSVLGFKPTAKLHEERVFWKKGGARVENSVSDEILQENEGRAFVKGCLNPRGGRADERPWTVRLGEEAGLTPRVTADRAAITHLEGP